MFTGSPTAARRIALVQAGLAPVLAAVGAVVAGGAAGLSLLYGALSASLLSALLMWREYQAMRHPEWDQHRLLKLFIRVGIERLVLLVALLVLGFGVLELMPLPLLLGLLAAQLAWFAVARAR